MHIGNDGGSSRPSRGRRSRRSHGSEEVALQITSMADIFTIILVFLLKSYSVSAINVNVGKDIKLPIARGGMDNVEAMKVEVTALGINLESQPVVTLKDYAPNSKDVAKDGTFPALVKALKTEREKQRQIASAEGQKDEPAKKDSKLLVIADKGVPYKLLKLVLASASTEDYTDFKLVVVQED